MNKSLKSRLLNNDVLIGSWITIGHPTIAEIMCKSGFDWLAIDLEHSTISLRDAEELIRTIDLCDVSPLVRLTSNNKDQIKRVMDAGSHGIIVPMVNSADEAKAAVDAAKYPPLGKRGVGLARAQGYGSNFDDYITWQKKEVVIIVQIEHIDAVNNLSSILSVDGIDGYIIGPYDLSASINKAGKFDDRELQDLIKKIKKIGDSCNKPGGIHVVEPDIQMLKKNIELGNKFIAYSVDIRMLDTLCREGASARNLV